MTKYRSKPELVDAIQWNKMGDHPRVLMLECGTREGWKTWGKRPFATYGNHTIPVNVGDYILTHSDGSLSVMSKEAFEKKYEIDGDEICLCKGRMRKFLVCQKCGTLEGIKEG